MKRDSANVSTNTTVVEGFVTSVDHLMMDAKQAILHEQHRRFQALQREGRWVEAMRQIHVTLSCASDLLNESLRVLDQVLDGAASSSAKDNSSVI